MRVIQACPRSLFRPSLNLHPHPQRAEAVSALASLAFAAGPILDILPYTPDFNGTDGSSEGDGSGAHDPFLAAAKAVVDALLGSEPQQGEPQQGDAGGGGGGASIPLAAATTSGIDPNLATQLCQMLAAALPYAPAAAATTTSSTDSTTSSDAAGTTATPLASDESVSGNASSNTITTSRQQAGEEGSRRRRGLQQQQEQQQDLGRVGPGGAATGGMLAAARLEDLLAVADGVVRALGAQVRLAVGGVCRGLFHGALGAEGKEGLAER